MTRKTRRSTAHEDATVLELGVRGKLARALGLDVYGAFELTGRWAIEGVSGGIWNEWVMTFAGGRTATLAEARGAFAIYEDGALAPAFDALAIGAPLAPPGFVVVERGEATRVGEWGDLPELPATYRYADLSSRSGQPATLDYGVEGAPRSFVGRHVTLSELGLAPRATRARFLEVPAAPPPRAFEPALAIGDEGAIDGARHRVIGVLVRSSRSEGERFTWQEYLLHAPGAGFRWLALSDGHWTIVTPIEAGLVTLGPPRDGEREPSKVVYDGVSYRPLSSGKARVEWAAGEFPWRVQVGDVVSTRDYVKAPHLISCEWSEDEIAWSRGTYTSPSVVAKAFGRRGLPIPEGRAPHQPRLTQTRPERRTP